MKAIILTAGYGNRMRPLTDTTHKTLLPIAGRTIIARIIDSLVDNGILDVVIVTGYREKELRDYLTQNYQHLLKLTFVHNERYRETNNIFSMALAFNAITIDTDIILIESDLVYEPVIIKKLLNSPHETVALVDKFEHGMDGTVVTVDEGIITNVIPPHLQGEHFDFSDKYKTLNIYKFSQEFCNETFKKLLTYYAQAIDDNCYYELILGILIYMQREVVHAEILSGEKWAEVDDPNDMRLAEFKFNLNKQQRILHEGFGGYWNYPITDFCFIRNMYFPNTAVISDLRNTLPDLIHNYGSRQSILNQKLALVLLCNPDRVQALNGASQLYPLLRSYLEGKKALIPSPTFGEYPRILPQAETYSDTIGISTGEIERKSESAEVIIFVNPNNPTGSLVQSPWIFDFAAARPDKTIIVDESFIEFSNCQSLLSLLEQNPLYNIIIIKSLSKSLGIPGIRLGYSYSCNEKFNAALLEYIPVWNSNSVAEYFMEIILKHRKSMQVSFTATINDREEFAQALAKAPAVKKVYPSSANFLLMSLHDTAPSVSEIISKLLREDGLYIKDISNKFTDGKKYVRLAVRLPEENKQLVAALAKIKI